MSNEFVFQDLPQDALEKINCENIKSRVFCGILYFDDESQNFAISCLATNKYNSVAIVHDACFNEDGEKKKNHLHFIIRFANPRYRFSVAEELKIKPNYIQSCSSFNSYCAYMVHLDEPFKTQYLPELAYGNLFNVFLKALNRVDDESIKVIKILNYINDSDLRTPFKDYLKWVCDNGLYDIYRRSYTMFRDIIFQKERWI